MKIADQLNGGPILGSSDVFGLSVVALGDVDGDGITDLAVGARIDNSSTVGIISESVYVLFLNVNGTVKSSVRIDIGINLVSLFGTNPGFGSSLAAMGDLDGDGVPDLAVGAHRDDTGGLHRGAVHVLFLKSDGTVKSSTKIASGMNGGPVLAAHDRFGASVTSMGDLNGDRVTDLVVGAFADDTGGTDRGAVHVLFMNPNGTVQSSVKIASGLNSGPTLADGDFFGFSVTSIGDWDADGVTDLAVGALKDDTGGTNRGAVHLLMMNANGTVKSHSKLASGINGSPTLDNDDLFGSSVAWYDLEGYGNLVVGARRDDTGGTDRGAVYVLHFKALTDFGDAPDTGTGTGPGNYQTLMADNGPSHSITTTQTTLFLGARVDSEADATPNINANGDDLTTLPDDEEGLIVTSTSLKLTPGGIPVVRMRATNTTGIAATLYGWIDYNQDGVFDNATERASVAVPTATNNVGMLLTFPVVPVTTKPGATYARFRLSTDVAAANSTGAAIGGEVEDYSATIGTIVSVAVSPSSVFENGSANLIYTFTRTGITTGATTVNFTVGGTATKATDYAATGAATFTATTGTVSFAANQTSKTVTVNPNGDGMIEPNETVILTVTPTTAYAVGTSNSATGTITNDDLPVVTLTKPQARILENDPTKVVFTFTRSGPTTDELEVRFAAGGNAILGADYTAHSRQSSLEWDDGISFVTFGVGETTTTVTIDPLSDTIVEGDETVMLKLLASAAKNYVMGTTAAVMTTIVNDASVYGDTVRISLLDTDGPFTISTLRDGPENTLRVLNKNGMHVITPFAFAASAFPYIGPFYPNFTLLSSENVGIGTSRGAAVVLDESMSGYTGMFSFFGGTGPDMLDASRVDFACFFDGGAGNDTLKGSSRGDEFLGGPGDDVAIGGDGNDRLNGEDGNDRLDGGAGDDTVSGGGGTNTLIGGTNSGGGGLGDLLLEDVQGNSMLSPTSLTGAVTRRTAVDEAFSVIPSQGGGRAVLSGFERFEVNGGDRDDSISASTMTVGVTINGQGGYDKLTGGMGPDSLVGGDGSDTLIGGPGNDTLSGVGENDELTGGSGDDVLDGGDDRDRVVEEADVDFRLTDSSLEVQAQDLELNQLIDIETALLTGGRSANRIDASAFTLGGVKLFGGDGNDELIGCESADLLDGGLGNDRLDGNGGDDVLNGGIDDDELLGGDGNDTMTGGGGNNRLNGGAGMDRLVESSNHNMTLTDDMVQERTIGILAAIAIPNFFAILGDIEVAVLTGGSGDNTIDARGWTGSSSLFGLGGKDVLIGGSGRDELDGGPGNDILSGDSGDDVLTGGEGTDIIDGGAGMDTLMESGNTDFLLTNSYLFPVGSSVGTKTLTNIETAHLMGGDGDNTLDAGRFTLGPVTLFGGRGKDSLIGGSRDDLLDGGDDNDALAGQGGNDMVNCGDGDDIASGGNGNDTIDGGRGNDFLIGGFGNDTINGGEGRDTALGGQGGPPRGGSATADPGDSLFGCEMIDEPFFRETLVELMIGVVVL